MKTIVVYRFSALGDVALALPVLRGVLDHHQDIRIIFVTREKFFPIFHGIDRLELFSADLKGRHKGVRGLFRLYSELVKMAKPDLVIDLHQVLRSQVLNFYFSLNHIPVRRYRKGRKEKHKALGNKAFNHLPHTIDRYSQVFYKNSFQLNLPEPPVINISEESIKECKEFLIRNSIQGRILAIAPFAAHVTKMWDTNLIEQLIEMIIQKHDFTIVLVGGGIEEELILRTIASHHTGCVVLANQISLGGELALFSEVKAAVAMDSSNMHLFSLLGIPTVSIWGATHPKLGFSPYQQTDSTFCLPEGHLLPCQPCSVYGSIPCRFQNIACMDQITVNQVYKTLLPYLS